MLLVVAIISFPSLVQNELLLIFPQGCELIQGDKGGMYSFMSLFIMYAFYFSVYKCNSRAGVADHPPMDTQLRLICLLIKPDPSGNKVSNFNRSL